VTTVPDVVERSELLLPGPAEGLAGLLGVEPPDLDREGLPLLWHWIYLLDRPHQADLGPDGHPVRGVIPGPPGEGRRRMWAGGRVLRRSPLSIGQEATRRSRVVSTTEKEGRSGRLTFVVVEHTISQAGRVVIDEEQHIVYRDAAVGADQPEPALPANAPLADGDRPLAITPSLLFRFSALTYNAHRIHYDRDYATTVEGYPGLLIHGPLQAMTMAEAARAEGASGPLSMTYRLVAPLFDFSGLISRADRSGPEWTTAVRDKSGLATAQGVVAPVAAGQPQKT
jgi:3-methylfumaryl-CoA hydratase